jgi:hypothetical protein
VQHVPDKHEQKQADEAQQCEPNHHRLRSTTQPDQERNHGPRFTRPTVREAKADGPTPVADALSAAIDGRFQKRGGFAD